MPNTYIINVGEKKPFDPTGMKHQGDRLQLCFDKDTEDMHTVWCDDFACIELKCTLRTGNEVEIYQLLRPDEADGCRFLYLRKRDGRCEKAEKYRTFMDALRALAYAVDMEALYATLRRFRDWQSRNAERQEQFTA